MTAGAIILAAGRGERMRPITDTLPKPLLPVHGRALIAWHLEALAAAGVREVAINTAWLEERLIETLGDGARFGVRIRWSAEGRDWGGALETAGGIATALPLLDETFWVVSADIHAPDFRFDEAERARFAASDRLAKVWLVPNPPFHPQGDFGLSAQGLGLADGTGPDGRRWTYANLALVRRELCAHVPRGTHAKLAPLLYDGMRAGRIAAAVYDGRWDNVGTPEQLATLNTRGA